MNKTYILTIGLLEHIHSIILSTNYEEMIDSYIKRFSESEFGKWCIENSAYIEYPKKEDLRIIYHPDEKGTLRTYYSLTLTGRMFIDEKNYSYFLLRYGPSRIYSKTSL